MTADEAYRWLVAASADGAADPFDVHVVASIIALAIAEAGDEQSLCEGIGLEPNALASLARALFPTVAEELREMSHEVSPEIDAEEQSVRDILLMYASGAGPLERPFAAMIARRCKAPHHLWQDLGLRDRGELWRLMQRHFSRLAARNAQDMKWKKFLYRMVCGSKGFTLCAAPVCSECDDFAQCFGAEDGEARLAQIRNEMTLAR